MAVEKHHHVFIVAVFCSKKFITEIIGISVAFPVRKGNVKILLRVVAGDGGYLFHIGHDKGAVVLIFQNEIAGGKRGFLVEAGIGLCTVRIGRGGTVGGNCALIVAYHPKGVAQLFIGGNKIGSVDNDA